MDDSDLAQDSVYVLGHAGGVAAHVEVRPVLEPGPQLRAASRVVSLPQFWLFTRAPRDAITLGGVAAALTVFGGTLGQGWSPQFLTGNAVFTVVAYAAGVGLGLWVYRFVGQSNERQERLTTELAVTQEELAAAYQQQGAAEERERLAREIHDTLAQGFASIVVLAEAARAATVTDPVRCAEQLTSIEQTARENLAEARVLVGSAPVSGVAPGSLATTLRRTLDRFVQDTGLTVTAELPDMDLDQRTRVALLRCTQESLANVRKHSGASTVGVVLTELAGGVELEITDDGCGFVVGESSGFGLDGMRRRLAELDGELAVTSSLGDGTRVLASLPTHSQD
ncbi:sensor histidine kinase [Streptomyces sp. NPDC004732]|uniref:sensor histidine kinase n=1 Tax=Streptomyces sp. NPDC004732 TaxID=3154290 RepID=UPI0033BBCDAE